MYFWNYRLWKSLSEKSLKSTVSEQALVVNMWNHPKCLRNLHESAFIMFFIILREIDLENVSPCVRWNLRGSCLRIHCLWQMSCSRLWEFATPKWNAIFRKTKNFFVNFLLHFWNLHQILTILKEKMIVIANVFSKLQTLKIFVRKLAQEHRFRTGFGSQPLKAT